MTDQLQLLERVQVFLDLFLENEPSVVFKSKVKDLLYKIFPEYTLEFQGRAPRVIAVSIIYLAHILTHYKKTQEELRLETNVSATAIRHVSHSIIKCLHLQEEIERAWVGG